MLHVSHPVLFKDIYCPLSITKLTTHEYDESSQMFKIKSVSTLMNQVNNIAIFGNAGSGKSTLVNYLYINSIEESYKFPILIYLRYLNLSTCSLVEYLKRQVLGYKNIECSDEIFSTLLENGCFLFFFDGYDEIVSEKQYNIAIQIKDLVTNYPANKYVLTSRPLEHLYVLDSFHNFVMKPLTADECNEFIRKQFPNNKKHMAETIINKISASPSNSYSQLLNTPLLIILCILNFKLNPDLPIKRSEFYSRIFDALFQGHDWRSKNGFERIHKCNLQKDDYISILGKFSFRTHFQSKYFFTKEEVISLFDIIKLGEKYNSNIQKINTANLFDDLNVAINILIADGCYYSFPHKSFQEFYVAMYVVKKSESSRKKIYKKFIDKFFQAKGFLLTAPLLEMLYEMDQYLMMRHFIIPLLNNIEKSIINKTAFVEFNKHQLEHIISVINYLFYGKDLFDLRNLFSANRIEYYLDEIRQLNTYASQYQLIDDDDIFMDEF